MMYNKWQSRRWWVTMWSMLMASIVIIYGVVEDGLPEGLGTALSLLVGVVGGYIAADSLTKKKE